MSRTHVRLVLFARPILRTVQEAAPSASPDTAGCPPTRDTPNACPEPHESPSTRADRRPSCACSTETRTRSGSLAGAFIQYPSALTSANCDLFDAMVGV